MIGGINVIESEAFAFQCAEIYKEVCENLSINLVFKASYDKANRSSSKSFRGPGIEKGLKILRRIKDEFKIPLISDVHTQDEAIKASEVLDIIQLPAFLARQTDLISALAKTNRVINIKKPQFLSPYQMRNVVNKFLEFNNNKLLICERGHTFGYDNLVVDMLGFGEIKNYCDDIPLIFDVTHSLQCREIGSETSSGRRSQILELARAGIALGLAGIFLESHPNPDKALCDGPSALPINQLKEFLRQLKSIDDLVKSLPKVQIK